MQTGNDLNAIIKDLTISYDDNGISTIPVIFIHGFPFDKNSWRLQVDHLKNDYRVINYDIRGYGNSTAGTQSFSIALFADDLIHLMDYLQLNKAIVCGLSMGGYILLNAMSRYPDRFAGVILCDTKSIADTPEGKDKRYATIKQIESSGLEEFANGLISKLFAPASLEQKPEAVNEIKNMIINAREESVTETLKALAAMEETDLHKLEINYPVLIICGAEDILTPPALSEKIHEAIEGSELIMINNSGHLTNLEQPEIFNRHILHFISSIKQ